LEKNRSQQIKDCRGEDGRLRQYVDTDQYGYISEIYMYAGNSERQRMFEELETMSPSKYVGGGGKGGGEKGEKGEREGEGEGDKERRRKEGEKSIWERVDRNSWGTDDYLHRVDREECPEYL
jgi:hypothetical protein